MTDRKAKPTAADKAAARNLKNAWLSLKRADRPTQEQIAEEWAKQWGNATQGLISQYMNGRLPLGLQTVLRFASILGIEPTVIRKDLPELAHLTPQPARNSAVPLRRGGEGWPFSFPRQRYERLTRPQKLKIEGAVLACLLEFETKEVNRAGA
jgi:hypothetical protein